jgi:hypothetical protein
MKILTPTQARAALRALKGRQLPSYYGCAVIRKTSGKRLPFGELPRGVSVEICREIINGKDVITARTTGPRRKRSRALAGRRSPRKRR